jgi:ankyrin repeat protein
MPAVILAQKLLDPSCVLTGISDQDGYTSLYVASSHGQLEVAKFLVWKGADINSHGMFSPETTGSSSCAHPD